jgi:hypothetical protein
MRILIQSWARLMLWSDVLYYITVPVPHDVILLYSMISYGYIMITLKYDRVMLMAVTGKRAGNPTDDHIIPT